MADQKETSRLIAEVAGAIEARQREQGIRPPDVVSTPSVDVAGTVAELERLQRLRRPRYRDNTIDALLRNTQQSAKEQRRRLGTAIDLWQELVEEPLRSRTRITGLRSGVLSVSVDTSADRFLLDRTLRAGLMRELQRRARLPLSRVRVTVEAAPSSAESDRRR